VVAGQIVEKDAKLMVVVAMKMEVQDSQHFCRAHACHIRTSSA
jgi:hypothetical protein